tara:strand:+ start:4096 stop:4923 length:828 start_codon:yes stop_codon:yes gene_type:complete
MKLMALLLLIIAPQIQAQMKMSVDPKTSKIKYDVLGSVINVQGSVFKQSKGESSSTRIGLKFGVKKGDILTTGKRSYVKIKLIDDTIISIGPESHFSFRNYKFESITDRNAAFDLLKGKMRIKVNNKIERGNLEFNTLSLAMGVRGTEFLASQNISKSGDSTEQVALLTGAITINGKQASISQRIKPNQIVRAKKTKNNKLKVKINDLSDKEILELNSPELEANSFLKFLPEDQSKFNFDSSDEISIDESASSKSKKELLNWQDSLKKLNEKYKK